MKMPLIYLTGANNACDSCLHIFVLKPTNHKKVEQKRTFTPCHLLSSTLLTTDLTTCTPSSSSSSSWPQLSHSSSFHTFLTANLSLKTSPMWCWKLHPRHNKKVLNLSGVKFRLTCRQEHLLYTSLILWSQRKRVRERERERRGREKRKRRKLGGNVDRSS